MNKIEIFKNERFGEIRVAGTSEEPLFCLADVCKAVGLKNPSSVKIRLDESDLCMSEVGVQTGFKSDGTPAMQVVKMTFINESGFYDVLLQSDAPQVKPFRKWVTSEVLPSIRKHGAYMTDDVIEKTLEDPDYMIQLITRLKEEKQKRIEAERKNAILMHVNKTYTATEIAKELNLKSAIQLNKILADKRVQFQSNGTWVFYAKYADLGYEEIKQEVLDNGKVVYHRKFTQMGRDFIVNLLSNNK